MSKSLVNSVLHLNSQRVYPCLNLPVSGRDGYDSFHPHSAGRQRTLSLTSCPTNCDIAAHL